MASYSITLFALSVFTLAAQDHSAAAGPSDAGGPSTVERMTNGSPQSGADATLDARRLSARKFWADGKIADAADEYRQVLRADQSTAKPNPHVGADLFSLGSVLVELNRLDEAKSCFEQALAFFHDRPVDAAEVRLSLAGIQVIEGAFAEAENSLKNAIDAFTSGVGVNDIRTARAWNISAWLYTIWGRMNEAEGASRKAEAIADRVLAPDSVERCRFLDYRAEYLAAIGRFADAEKLWRKATDLLQKAAGNANPQYDAVYLHLAQAYSWTGDYKPAQEMLKQFLDIERKIAPTGSIAQAVGLAELGNTYTQLHRYPDAESYLAGSVDMLARLPNAVPLTNAFVEAYFGDYYMSRGRWLDAENSYRKALDLRRQAAPGSALVAGSMSGLAAALEKLKRKDEAKKYREEAQAILAVQHNPAYSGDTVDVKSFRGK